MWLPGCVAPSRKRKRSQTYPPHHSTGFANVHGGLAYERLLRPWFVVLRMLFFGWHCIISSRYCDVLVLVVTLSRSLRLLGSSLLGWRKSTDRVTHFWRSPGRFERESMPCGDKFSIILALVGMILRLLGTILGHVDNKLLYGRPMHRID